MLINYIVILAALCGTITCAPPKPEPKQKQAEVRTITQPDGRLSGRLAVPSPLRTSSKRQGHAQTRPSQQSTAPRHGHQTPPEQTAHIYASSSGSTRRESVPRQSTYPQSVPSTPEPASGSSSRRSHRQQRSVLSTPYLPSGSVDEVIQSQRKWNVAQHLSALMNGRPQLPDQLAISAQRERIHRSAVAGQHSSVQQQHHHGHPSAGPAGSSRTHHGDELSIAAEQVRHGRRTRSTAQQLSNRQTPTSQ